MFKIIIMSVLLTGCFECKTITKEVKTVGMCSGGGVFIPNPTRCRVELTDGTRIDTYAPVMKGDTRTVCSGE